MDPHYGVIPDKRPMRWPDSTMYDGCVEDSRENAQFGLPEKSPVPLLRSHIPNH